MRIEPRDGSRFKGKGGDWAELTVWRLLGERRAGRASRRFLLAALNCGNVIMARQVPNALSAL
jgi:hypothetical protein